MAIEKTVGEIAELSLREFGPWLEERNVTDFRISRQGKMGWFGKVWFKDLSSYTTPPQKSITDTLRLIQQKLTE